MIVLPANSDLRWRKKKTERMERGCQRPASFLAILQIFSGVSFELGKVLAMCETVYGIAIVALKIFSVESQQDMLIPH